MLYFDVLQIRPSGFGVPNVYELFDGVSFLISHLLGNAFSERKLPVARIIFLIGEWPEFSLSYLTANFNLFASWPSTSTLSSTSPRPARLRGSDTRHPLNRARLACARSGCWPDPITQTPAQALWRRMQTPFRRIPVRERIRECITRWDGARCSAGLHAITKETRSFKFPPIASRVTPSSSPGWFWRLTQKVGYPNDLAPAASHPAKAAKRIWSGFKPKASRPI